MTTANLTALDLFAGTGWGVACARLGIEEYGVEIIKEAVATRDAAGMRTVYGDVWDGLLSPQLITDAVRAERLAALERIDDGTATWYDILIASPPCQTFSMAGKGAGRKALEDVLAAIERGDHEDPERLHALTESLDDRTALVLTPLAHVFRDRPQFVVLEQVPTVLPVWEACAEAMRAIGYSVVTGVLNAEQYGVPQTRKRAILIGIRDGEAVMPTPTHSRYYPRTPEKLDEGVDKWVSMAEALGWQSDGPDLMRSNYGTGGNSTKRGERTVDQPPPTVTSKVDRNKWIYSDNVEAVKVMGKGMVERHGERPGRPADHPADHPAFTIRASAGGMEPGGFVFRDTETGETRRMEPEEAAVLQGYPEAVEIVPGASAEWVFNRPSPTVVGTFAPNVIAAPGYRRPGDGPRQNTPGSVKVTEDEAAVLQSYPRAFPFQGARGKRFLQIGNAVPPLLAEAILSTIVSAAAATITSVEDLELAA